MRDVIALLASELSNKNIMVDFKHNSVFEPLALPGAGEKDLNMIAGAISRAVGSELLLIRSKLLPLLSEFIVTVQNKANEFKAVPESSKYTVTEVTIPSLVGELQANGTLRPKRNPAELTLANVYVPTPSMEEIRGYFKHAIPSMDIYAASIVSKYTDEDLVKLWERYLSNVSKNNVVIRDMGLNPLLNIDELIMLFVVVSNLKETKPTNTTIDADAFTNVMNEFYFEILNYIAIAVSNYELFKNGKRMIIDVKDKYTIKVHKDVYNEFINEGYSVETLLGLLIKTPAPSMESMYLDNIKINADVYTAEWDKFIKLNNIMNVGNEQRRYGVIYSIALNTLYDELIPGDLKDVVSNDSATAHVMLTKLLGGNTASATLDIENMAKEIVGGIVFEKTNLKRFVDNMLEYKKQVPTLTTANTASFACVDIIMDYLLDQINIVNSAEFVRK